MDMLGSTLSIFAAAIRKEIVQQWRTKRFVIAIAVFILFGLGSPMMVKITPELAKSDPVAVEMLKMLPPPTAADAVDSYIDMVGMFGMFLAVILGMNAVAGEKESGTASLILSKPIPRWAFVLSKYIAQSLVYMVCFLAGGLAAYYCTVVLFGAVELTVFMKISLILLLWFSSFAGLALLASVVGRTVAAAGGVGLGLTMLISLARNIPQYGPWSSSGLMAWAKALAANGEKVTADPRAIEGTLALILICMILSVALFQRQELA